jgi:uncharacterized repeat protein (TIGR02543 family)
VDGTTIDSQIVATNDTLTAPEAPVKTGMRFIGWYDESNTLFTAFGTQTVTVTGSSVLTAQYEAAYYAFFHNQYGSIIETRTPDSSNQVSTADVTSLQVASDEAFMGWSTSADGTNPVGSSVTVEGGNINLYPIIEKVIWITFDSNGGAYISPTYVAPGTALTQELIESYVASQNDGSSTITKTGYAFTGWSGFTFGETPTSSVTLSAGWTAQTVNYTVIIWQEDVSGNDNYNVVAGTIETRQAVAETTVSPTSDDTSKSYKGFDYNASKSVSVTVKGDGSSVLNVYYDRETWTVNFYRPKKTSSGMDTNDLELWNSVSGLYDSKLNYWPDASSFNTYYDTDHTNYSFTGWLNTNGWYLTYLEKFDDGGSLLFTNGVMDLTAQFTTSSLSGYAINHIKQNLDLTWPSSASLTAYAYTNGNFQINNRFEGFTAYVYNTNLSTNWGNVTPGETMVYYTYGLSAINIRHSRNSYDLTVRNFNTQLSTTSVLYEMPLTSYEPAQPSRPFGIPSDYVWAGWYTTQEGYAGSEVDWSITMPANDLIVYGVWKAPTFTGIAHSVSYGTAGGSTVDLGEIAYGGTISASALEAAQNAAEADNPNTSDIFGGWLIYKNGSLILFNSSMLIYENVVLYPVWISGESYEVTYDLGEATGTEPTDGEQYGSGGQAQVLAYDTAAVTPPVGKRFIGWLSNVDGKLYYPNSAITITQDTVLTAQWSSAAVTITITYDANGGALPGGGTTVTANVPNNTTHTIQGNAFVYTGKEFVCWNTASDGSGTSYWPGTGVLVGASVPTAPSTLYAVWKDQTFAVTVLANPAVGVASKTGAGTYLYGSDATVSWTLAEGYEITSVTDNGTPLDAAQYTGNSYALTGLVADHEIQINTVMTLFTLTYNGNGGTFGGSGSYSSTKTMGTSFSVDENKFTKDGFYFLGWSTDPSATAADAAYAPRTSVTMPNSDLTLYAVWAAKTPLTLTAASATLSYDGTEKSVSGIVPSISGLTVEGATAGASGTEPSRYPTSFQDQNALVLKNGDDDVTERYTVT